MILLVLWAEHLARPLYFRVGILPTPQKSSLFYPTPKTAVIISLVSNMILLNQGTNPARKARTAACVRSATQSLLRIPRT